MNDLPPELQSLIEHARDGHDPDPHAKHRVRAALTLSIAAATVATTATAKGLSPLVLGLLLTGGSIAAVTVAAFTLDWNSHGTPAPTRAPTAEITRSRSRATPPKSSDAPSVAAPSVIEAAEPSIEVGKPVHRTHRSHPITHDAPRASSQATPESSSTLADELDLVTRAAKATSAQQWSEAIALLDQHAERFPRGSLAEERSGLRALSLCKLRRPEGSVAAERFVRAYPSSPLIERLRASCAELP